MGMVSQSQAGKYLAESHLGLEFHHLSLFIDLRNEPFSLVTENTERKDVLINIL